MSLADFQRAFAVVVTAPAVWAARLAEPDARVGALELTAVERERLRRILAHRGMAANHLLLRANRMMPIRGALPLTCDWLRACIDEVMDGWLACSHDASVQYQREATRFARWLPGWLAARGRTIDPALDALRHELALAELVAKLSRLPEDAEVEVVLDHDPEVVLAGWCAEVQPLAVPQRLRLRVDDGMIVLERCA